MAVGDQNGQPQGEGYGNSEADSAGSATQTNGTTDSGVKVDSSNASGLSLGSIVGGVASTLTSFFNLGGVTLPLSNPLHSFASYTYIFTLYAMNSSSINSPGGTFFPGLPVICRSGSGNPNARINTEMGKQEFYIDKVVIDSLWGFNGKTGNSIAQQISFEVIEPYSMGGFVEAMQAATYKMGFNTYVSAPFCLQVQFMGISQDGSMTAVPNTTKSYSMIFEDVDMEVTNSGSKYRVKAIPVAESALRHSSIKITSELSFSGKTVEETLSSGKDSLVAVYNRRLKEIASDNGFGDQPDQIAITFPTDLSSGSSAGSSIPGFGPELSVLPTVQNLAAGATSSVLSSLGLSGTAGGGFLSSGGMNELGASKLGYGPTREGMAVSSGAESYDEKNKTFDQSKVTKDAAESSFSVSQNSTIINAINQVLLSSEYAAKVLKQQPDGAGMDKMWIIIPAVYFVDSISTYANTGRKPKLMVYKVYPYKVNRFANMALPGVGSGSVFQNLFNATAKRYEYLYTGKNTNIKDLKIRVNPTFMLVLASDNNRRAQDVELAPDNNSVVDNFVDILSTVGKVVVSPLKSMINQVGFFGTFASSDQNGGGGEETESHRAARNFFDTMQYGTALAELNMQIVGDPYWMTSSGTGNSFAGASQYDNLGTDMSVNPYSGEVDFYLHFRVPSDVNQSTGLMDFSSGTAAQQYTGLYKVQKVKHTFADGEFYQDINALRRNLSPNEPGAPAFSTANTIASLLGKIF